jgi:Uri superfamily endonuclease
LKNKASAPLQIGKLGLIELIPGYYIYIGSAFGPGGIAARTAHHRKTQPRPHWHIDYLRKAMPIIEIWFSYDRVRREHQWANILPTLTKFSQPMHGFGASDCNCTTHLFFSPEKPDFAIFHAQAIFTHPEHSIIYIHHEDLLMQ